MGPQERVGRGLMFSKCLGLRVTVPEKGLKNRVYWFDQFTRFSFFAERAFFLLVRSNGMLSTQGRPQSR